MGGGGGVNQLDCDFSIISTILLITRLISSQEEYVQKTKLSPWWRISVYRLLGKLNKTLKRI